MTRQTRAVRAGSFHPNLLDHTKRRQPTMQLRVTRWCGRERFDTQHTAVRVNRSSDMHIRVRINSARHQARGLYDGHRHPFFS